MTIVKDPPTHFGLRSCFVAKLLRRVAEGHGVTKSFIALAKKENVD